jgi:Right handed beta helix region
MLRYEWLAVIALGCSATRMPGPMADDDPLTGFFVAPGGSDEADGSIDAPFATVQRAVVAMRSSSDKQTHVRGGFYELAGDTIALDARDSGVELLAYPGETPVLSGGRAITAWTPVDADHHIWSAHFPSELRQVGAVTVDGVWFDVARTPNRDPADPQAHGNWLFVEQSLGPPVANPWDPSFNADNAFTYRGDDLDPALGIDGEPDAWVSIWDKFGWSSDILQIASIDHDARAVQLRAASQFGLAPDSRYFVYGVRSALDAPGEFYVDLANQQVLLIPRDGGDPNAAVVVASEYDGPPLISIDGAEGVHIAGFELRDQHNTGRWAVDPGGGVKVISGDNAWIERNTFHALGVGIDVEAGSGHRIERNTIYDIATSGIAMFGDATSIAANEIHDTGLVEQASHGIIIGPGRNVIAHNHIANVPHYAVIAVGDKADGLIVEYNVIERASLGANDTGAIYLKNRGNYNPAARETVRFNAIYGSGGIAVGYDGSFSSPGFSFGVYLDDGQSGTDVYGNLFVGTSAGAVFPHNGTDNHIENNVIISGVQQQLFIESANAPAGNVFERNIFASANLTPAIFIKYHGQEATLASDLFYNWTDPSYVLQRFFAYDDGATLSFDDARIAGFHRDCLVADPRFVDAANGDYRLQAGSPAFDLGFVELPYDRMGPAGF